MNQGFSGAELILEHTSNKNKHGTNEIHRAGWVMSRPDHIIENGYVRIENGIITEVSGGNSCLPSYSDNGPEPGVKIIDHGDGVLMPGLFNAHFHLELSALEGKISFDRGFRVWVRQLLEQRENIGKKTLLEKADNALNDMIRSGSLFGAEISTLGITENIVKNSMLRGIWFKELLGSSDSMNFFELDELLNDIPPKTSTGIEKSVNEKDGEDPAFKEFYLSFAGHAPHTSSPRLLTRIKKMLASRKLVFSIHCAESYDESEFIQQGHGPWACFLKERNIDFSSWPIPAASPVDYLFKLGLLDPFTILVHLLNLDDKDFETIADSGAKPVLCPRSNMNLHAKLPDIQKFLQMGLAPALGTDSLASCDSLSIFDEMAFIADHFPGIAPLDIITMATINGASALGMDKIAGTLEKGKTGNFIYIPLRAATKEDLIEKIIAVSF